MSQGPMWRRYLRFFGPDNRADLEEEFRFHLDMRRERLARQGLSDAEARAEAARRFGDLNTFREECERIDATMAKSSHRGERLGLLGQDLRFTWRQLRRSPVVTLAVMLVLGLGIGASAAIYSLLDAILLRPLPSVPRPAELVSLTSASVSYQMWSDFQAEVAGKAEVAGFSPRSFAVGASDKTEMVQGIVGTGNYFSVLGAPAAIGRVLGLADDVPGAAPMAVLSHRFWRARLGGDSAILGRALQVNGYPVTIVGIAPPRFRGSQLATSPDLWMTANGWLPIAGPNYRNNRLDNRGWTWLQVIARLRPGTTIDNLQAVITRSVNNQIAAYPNNIPPTEVRLQPATLASTGRDGRGTVVGFMGVLAGTVGLVLLLAAANVANLLLARAAERRREIAVRTALGAGRGRLAGQFLTESLVLALGGGVIGLIVAPLLLGALRRWTFPGGISLGALGLTLDWRLVIVALLLAVVTGVLFGLAPAVQAGRQDPAAALYGARAGAGRDRRRLQAVLLASQVAISLTLLIGAGLFGSSLRRGLKADLGFNAEPLAVASVNLALSRYNFAQADAYYERALQEVKALPGVVDAAWMLASPLTSDSDAEGFQIVGDPPPPRGERRPIVEVNVVSPSYWRMLDLSVLRGRSLEESDEATAPHVTVVNETFVNRYSQGRDPIGLRVALGEDTVEIVGVARDMAYHSIREEPRPYAYFAAKQMLGLVGLSPLVLMVRSTGQPEAILPSLRAGLASVDPRVPITGPAALSSLLDEVLLPERLGVLLVGLCSLLAAIVAGVGIAAAVAYAVGRHRRDLALCIALGAEPPRALREVLSPTLIHMGAGLGLGLIGGVALGRALSGVLYGLSGVEPMTLGLVTIGVVTLALVATLIPARKALRLDPMEELRAD